MNELELIAVMAGSSIFTICILGLVWAFIKAIQHSNKTLSERIRKYFNR